MPRQPVVSPQLLDRWIREWHGDLEHSAYDPWINVRDISSIGESHRPYGSKARREHHLLSGGEYNTFLHLDFATWPSDIREGYALLPVEETVAIAESLGIRYPTYPHSDTPVVLTSDFLVTHLGSRGEKRFRPLTYKPKEAIDKKSGLRVLEKFEIERRYWLVRDRPWQMVLSDSLNPMVTRNLDWLQKWNRLSDALTPAVPDFLASLGRRRRGDTLKDVLNAIARRLDCDERRDADCLFGYCAWSHLVELDLSVRVGLLYVPAIRRINFEQCQMAA